MIQVAIKHFADQLNRHFQITYALAEPVVVVSNLADVDSGTTLNNKLVLSLVNIEIDRASQGLTGSIPLSGLNLSVVLAANFTGTSYTDGLKFISDAISLVGSRHVFIPKNPEEQASGIEKLILEIENLNIHDLSHVWRFLGSKHLPSVHYRVRVVRRVPVQFQEVIPVSALTDQ